MNNHDRAKQIAKEIIYATLDKCGTDGIVAEVERHLDALDATDANERRSLSKTIAECLTKPKPRPAFIGDEVVQHVGGRDYRGLSIVGAGSRDSGCAVCYTPTFHDRYSSLLINTLRHPDGAPVSRIIEHRRPIPVSERLPTEEDANAYGKALTFWGDGDVLMAKWCAPALSTGAIIAWLPCPESGVE